MSQIDFWLYPLLALSIVSLVMRLSLPIKWAWGFILQAVPIIVLAVLGLFTEPKWIFALSGWVLVLIFYLPPKLFYSAMQKNLTDLNAIEMRKISSRVRFFFWGMAGRFWSDMALAMACYIEQNGDEAEQILQFWTDCPDLPAQIRSLPANYRKIGNSVMWRWQWIVDDYEGMAEEERSKLGSSVLLPTARAYAELGQFDQAADCIERAKLGETMVSMNFLALSLLPFFALTGSLKKVENLIQILVKCSGSFAESSRYYWLGRCYLARGEKDLSGKSFEKAAGLSTSPVFKKRLELLSSRLSEGAEPVDAKTVSNPVEKVWGVFKQVAYVQEILSPQRNSIAVNSLVVLIVIAFLVTDLSIFDELNKLGILKSGLIPLAPLNELIAYRLELVRAFALTPAEMLHGEYYRLLTYLFLHKHATHMIFNVIGLVWFGRIAENIFGTTRFVSIYLVGGVLSGIAHVLLSHLPAMGASGAVMAVFGAVAAGIFRLKNKIPESIWRFKLSMLGGLALFQIILDQIIPHVAVFAHLGGLLAGLAFGSLLSIRSPDTENHEITGQYVSG